MKIVRTIVVCFLIILPFLSGGLISKYSPYIPGNSIGGFITAYLILVLITAMLLFFILNRYRHLMQQPITAGVLLFFIGSIMAAIAGMAAPPDVSVAMLQYPEREHCRYTILFIGALLFAAFMIYYFKTTTVKRGKSIMILLFVLALSGLVWEFSHHYLYPEALKEWIAKGKKAEAFGKHYDDYTVACIGAVGRLVQFSLIMWLSIQLYKTRRINLWSPILSSVFCILGMLSAIIMIVTKMHYPKPLEFLFLFFIPGIPFLILYWLGVALLTRPNKIILKY